jgi:hypothetical protein
MGLVEKLMPLFKVVFMAVILDDKSCRVYSVIRQGNRVLDTIDKKFDIKNSELSHDVITHINRYQEKYKFVYIGTLLNSINQGSIKGIKKDDFRKFGIAYNNVESVPIDKSWSVYGFLEDLGAIKDKFSKFTGLDFIFSPFILLKKIFENDFTNNNRRLYVLCQKTSVAISIFNGKQFLFGAYFSIGDRDTFSSDNASSSNTNNSSDTDDMEEELVFFEEDEDVIALDESGAEKEDDEPVRPDNIASLEEFNEGVELHNFIKSSIEEFYKNDKYDNDFINDISIANACNLTDEIVQYIKDELMMNIDVKKVDIAKITAQIIEEEVLN